MAEIISSFIQKPEKTSYEGRDNDEQVLYVIRKSRLVLIYRMLILAVALTVPFFAFPVIFKFNFINHNIIGTNLMTVTIIFWFLACFGYFITSFINWYFNVLIISNKKIVDIDVNGLLYKNISEASLRNIEDVTSTVKGTLGTIFNIGAVFIQTAGETREFEFPLVDDPSKIRDIISDLVSNLKVHGLNN